MSALILVVEDEAIVAESIASKLRRFGYDVPETIAAGEIAVEVAGEIRPDVILMDIHLAGEMDGISAACIISARYKIPIVFLTAYADEDTIDRAKEAGPFGYLVKPFREKDLYTTIEMAREQSRLHRELEAANQELDSFSYSVSHDLRAPLIAIDGYSKILKETYAHLLPEDGIDCIDRIISSSGYMDRMIGDFLRLSRVSRTTLVKETLNITEIAKRHMKLLESSEPDKTVLWKVDDGMTAVGDKGLIEIVITNLLGNAWKYTGKTKQPIIHMGTTSYGKNVTFFVRDNGAGFPMDKVDRLFMPLQRLHSQDEFPGNGIGLATVQRIINRHGGKIWATGEVNKGAIFSFTLGSEE